MKGIAQEDRLFIFWKRILEVRTGGRLGVPDLSDSW